MAHKKLYRSTQNRVLGGVAAGIADYFDIDPIIVRLIFILLAIGHGIGFLFYLIAWVIIPEEPTSEASNPTPDTPKKDTDSKKEMGDEIHDRVNTVANEIRDAADKFREQGHDSRRSTAGMILLLLGGLFLINNFVNFDVWSSFWPLILIIIGLAIILNSRHV